VLTNIEISKKSEGFVITQFKEDEEVSTRKAKKTPPK
jgi:hypothetical protein